MTDAPTWEDRYHPVKILHPGSAPKGWDPEFRFAPYVRADTAIAKDAPELVALREALESFDDDSDCYNAEEWFTARLTAARAVLAAFDALMEGKP